MINTDHLISGAGQLSRSPKAGKPRQADLRRALSTAYYALFHRLLREGADRLVGSSPAKRATHSWVLVYRAYNHGDMSKRCGQVANPPLPLTLADFSRLVRRVASEFKTLQNERHRADYDPRAVFQLSVVQSRVRTARAAIKLIDALPPEDSRLFVTFLLLGQRNPG